MKTEGLDSMHLQDQVSQPEAEPLLSILSLCYNQEKYIREAIEGFLMQKTNFGFEILIHDDASTDGTADIIREYQAKYPTLIKPILRKENRYSRDKGFGGIFKSLNDVARGKYIAFCEGDDYWTDPYKLQKQVDFLEANPDYGLVHTDNMCLEESSGVMNASHKSMYYPDPPSGEVFYELLRMNFITTLTVVCRRELLAKAISSMFQWLDMAMHRDISTWLEIARVSRVKYLRYVTAVYRVNAGSVSRQLSDKSHAAFLHQGLQIILAFADHYNVASNRRQDYINRYFNDHMAMVAIHKELFIDFRGYIQSYQPRDTKMKIYKYLFLYNINAASVARVIRPMLDLMRRIKRAVKPSF